MADRSALKNATKAGGHSISSGLGSLKSTVKTATDVVGRGKSAPKAALSAARSLTQGDSPAKAAVSPLKEVGERMLGKKGKSGGGGKPKVTNIIEEIDIGAPRRLVYDQWTRFQDFPSITKKVKTTDQVTDEKLQWTAKIFWSTRTWESTIVEQIPDERIVWRSKGSKGHVDGAVTFHELTPDLTRVLLVLEYHPQGFMEKTGNLWRAQGRRARLELKHFRRHVMTQTLLAEGDDAEGWRGEIRDSEVVTTHEDAVAGEKDESDGGGKAESGGTAGARTSSGGGRSSGTRRSASGSRSPSGTSGGGRSSGSGRPSGAKRASGGRRSSSTGGSPRTRRSSRGDDE